MIRSFLFLLFASLLVRSAPIDLEANAHKFVNDLVAKVRADDPLGALDLIYAKFLELFPGLFNEKDLEGFKAGLYGDIETLKKIANSSNTEEGVPLESEFLTVGPEQYKFWKQRFDALGKEGQDYVKKTVKYITSFGKMDQFLLHFPEAIVTIDEKFDKLSETTKKDVITQFPFFGNMKEMNAIVKEIQKIAWKKIMGNII